MADLERYIDDVTNDLDANTVGSATGWIDVETCEGVAVYVGAGNGSHTTHEVVVQMSPDGVLNGGAHEEGGAMKKIVAGGHMHIDDAKSISYIRAYVFRAEGSASNIDVHIQGFRRK